MIDEKTIHAIGNRPYAPPKIVETIASFTGMPYTVSATTNAAISAAVAATHAGFRSAPSMMKSTMIGTAAASADRPSEPPRGAYVCVHMSGRNHTTIFEDLRIYDLRI